MAISAIVAFCLLATASAALQDLENLQCATSCDMSRQSVRGDIGKTYIASYNVQSIINITGVKDAESRISNYGNIYFTRINPCEVIMKFTDNDESANVNKYAMVFTLSENDIIEKLCAHPDDDFESVNIKRGIVSQLQYFLPSFGPTTNDIITEKTVLGSCPISYSVQNNGEMITVQKDYIHSECKEHVHSQSGLPTVLSKFPLPVHVSKSECEQVLFDTTKIPSKVICKDTNVIRPAIGAYKYIEAIQESTLQLISESTDIPSYDSIKGVKLVPKQWGYDNSMSAKNPTLAEKLDSVLRNICSMIQGQGYLDVVSYVSKAIELLKHVPDGTFVTVLNKIRSGEYCADYSKLESLFLDAVAFIGESGALIVMAQEAINGSIEPNLAI